MSPSTNWIIQKYNKPKHVTNITEAVMDRLNITVKFPINTQTINLEQWIRLTFKGKWRRNTRH